LLFEATHLIAVDHKEEVQSIWRWGTMILAGILFPAVAHPLAELLVSQKKPAEQKAEVTDAEKPAEQNAEVTDAEKPGQEIVIEVTPNAGIRARLISSVLIGDFAQLVRWFLSRCSVQRLWDEFWVERRSRHDCS
jgi:hypothetical protein